MVNSTLWFRIMWKIDMLILIKSNSKTQYIHVVQRNLNKLSLYNLKRVTFILMTNTTAFFEKNSMHVISNDKVTLSISFSTVFIVLNTKWVSFNYELFCQNLIRVCSFIICFQIFWFLWVAKTLSPLLQTGWRSSPLLKTLSRSSPLLKNRSRLAPLNQPVLPMHFNGGLTPADVPAIGCQLQEEVENPGLEEDVLGVLHELGGALVVSDGRVKQSGAKHCGQVTQRHLVLTFMLTDSVKNLEKQALRKR